MNDLKQACRICRYYQPTPGALDQGKCRRYPPVADEFGTGRWPEVNADDWCGEFNLSGEAMRLDQTARRLMVESFAPPSD
jgi:hypothetical protein